VNVVLLVVWWIEFLNFTLLEFICLEKRAFKKNRRSVPFLKKGKWNGNVWKVRNYRATLEIINGLILYYYFEIKGAPLTSISTNQNHLHSHQSLLTFLTTIIISIFYHQSSFFFFLFPFCSWWPKILRLPTIIFFISFPYGKKKKKIISHHPFPPTSSCLHGKHLPHVNHSQSSRHMSHMHQTLATWLSLPYTYPTCLEGIHAREK
jgi:hypothetical protein